MLLVSGRLSYLVIRYQIEPQWIKGAPLRAAIGQLRRLAALWDRLAGFLRHRPYQGIYSVKASGACVRS